MYVYKTGRIIVQTRIYMKVRYNIIEGKEMMDDKSLSQTVDWNSRSVHGVPVDVVALRHIVSCSKYFISRGSASTFQTQDVFVP